MAEKSRGMGRGLSAILTTTAVATTTTLAPNQKIVGAEHASPLRNLPVNTIVPNPNQPRHRFDEEALVALADSIKEQGVLQPILVRKLDETTHELVAGERRWRAAKLAGLAEVPALIGLHTDAQSLELAVIENMAREDLNPVEEARACALLVEELGLTREQVGRKVGRSRVAVSNLVRLLDLPDETLKLLEARELSEGHGRAVLLVSDHEQRRRLARTAKEQGWSVRRTEDEARALITPTNQQPSDERRDGTEWLDRLARTEAADNLAERFTTSTGLDISVKPAGKRFQITLTVDSIDEGMSLANRFPKHQST